MVRRKILIIDDEEILITTFARLLDKVNYEVLVASRPEEALAIAEEKEFDLILCDIRMPGKNGVETIQEMRAIEKSRGRDPAPVIFLTGFADPKLEEEARTLNPAAYLFKPFDTPQLLELIETTLQSAPRRESF